MLIQILKALLFLFALTTARTAMASSFQCELHADRSLEVMDSELRTLFPKALVQYDNVTTPATFQNEPQALIDKMFPGPESLRVAQIGKQLHLLFTTDSPAEAIRKVHSFPIKKGKPLDPRVCEALSSIRFREQSFANRRQGLLEALLETPNKVLKESHPRLHGHSYIEAESLRYQKAGQTYPLDELKKEYSRILQEVQKLYGQRNSLRMGLEVIRGVLAKEGLSQYCVEFISFKDFIEQGCTNCQGQTLLLVSLAKDLGLKDEEPWRFGIQLMRDHVRAVLYDGKDVIDVLYGKIEEDTGDPIFPPSFLAASSLRLERRDLGIEARTSLKAPEHMKPINQKFLGPFRAAMAKFRSTLNTKDDKSFGAVTLYDFSGHAAVTKFNPDHPQERADLDLSNNLLRPQRKTNRRKGSLAGALGNFFGQFVKSRNSCSEYDTEMAADILSEKEMRDRIRISTQGKASKTDRSLYGDKPCPGKILSKNRDVVFFSRAPEQLLAIDQALPEFFFNVNSDLVLPEDFALELKKSTQSYKEKMRNLEQHLISQQVQTYETLANLFRGPMETFPSVFRQSSPQGLALMNSVDQLSRSLTEREGFQKYGILADPVLQDAVIEFLRAYFEFHDRALQNPDVFFNSINELSTEEASLFTRTVTKAFNIFSEVYAGPTRDYPYEIRFEPEIDAPARLFASKLTDQLNRSIERLYSEGLSPFHEVGKAFLIDPKHRVALSPLSEAMKIQWRQDFQEAVESQEEREAQEALEERVRSKPYKAKVELPVSPMPPPMRQAFRQHCSKGHRFYFNGFAYPCPPLESKAFDENQQRQEEIEAQEFQEEREEVAAVEGLEPPERLTQRQAKVLDLPPDFIIQPGSLLVLLRSAERQSLDSKTYLRLLSLIDPSFVELIASGTFEDTFARQNYFSTIDTGNTALVSLLLGLLRFSPFILDSDYPAQEEQCLLLKDCLIKSYTPKFFRSESRPPAWVKDKGDLQHWSLIKAKFMSEFPGTSLANLDTDTRTFRNYLDNTFGDGEVTVDEADLAEDATLVIFDIFEEFEIQNSSFHCSRFVGQKALVQINLPGDQVLIHPCRKDAFEINSGVDFSIIF